MGLGIVPQNAYTETWKISSDTLIIIAYFIFTTILFFALSVQALRDISFIYSTIIPLSSEISHCTFLIVPTSLSTVEIGAFQMPSWYG